MRCVRSREQRTVLVEQGQTLLLSDDVAAQYPDALCQVCLESQPPLCRQTRDCCLAVMAVVTWVGLAGHSCRGAHATLSALSDEAAQQRWHVRLWAARSDYGCGVAGGEGGPTAEPGAEADDPRDLDHARACGGRERGCSPVVDSGQWSRQGGLSEEEREVDKLRGGRRAGKRREEREGLGTAEAKTRGREDTVSAAECEDDMRF
eukprot:2904922-Rhodomonas_salina.1